MRKKMMVGSREISWNQVGYGYLYTWALLVLGYMVLSVVLCSVFGY